jgi:hypothetical protein
MLHPNNLGEALISNPKFLESGRGSLTQVNDDDDDDDDDDDLFCPLNQFYVFFYSNNI